MNQVKEGEQGQICVSGLNVALGYVHNSGNGRFIPNEFNTKNDPSIQHSTITYLPMANFD